MVAGLRQWAVRRRAGHGALSWVEGFHNAVDALRGFTGDRTGPSAIKAFPSTGSCLGQSLTGVVKTLRRKMIDV